MPEQVLRAGVARVWVLGAWSQVARPRRPRPDVIIHTCPALRLGPRRLGRRSAASALEGRRPDLGQVFLQATAWITGVIGVGQDITEFRVATMEQQRVAEDLARAIETANAPIFGVDAAGCVTEWNRKAVEP